jgi:uncharacterized lipoprotein YmbA
MMTFAMILGSGVMLSGCLSKQPIVPQSFSFIAPSGTSDGSPALAGVLRVRRVVVAAPFDGQALTYRTGEYSFERDPYAQFLVPPADSLSAALDACFRKAGGSEEIAEPGSLLRANTTVEVYVDKLYGDFRNPDEPKAVLAIRFVFLNATRGSPAGSLLDHEYLREIPLAARTAAALVAGWNDALRQIVAAAVADLKQEKKGQAESTSSQDLQRIPADTFPNIDLNSINQRRQG